MYHHYEEECFEEDLHFYDGLSVVEEESDSDLFSEIPVECGDTDNIPYVTSLSSSSFSSSFSAPEEEDYSGEVMRSKVKEKRRYIKIKPQIPDASSPGSGSQDTDISYTDTSDERNFTGPSLRSYNESEPSFEGDRVDWELFGIENGLPDIR